MQKLIILKYGELSTKKGNINFFIKTLKNNILKKTNGLNCDITSDKGRMFIKTNQYDLVLAKLTKIFGIHELEVGYELENTQIETIKDKLIELLSEKTFKTFKVHAKRSDKSYPLTSPELNQTLGGLILNHFTNTTVDLFNPDLIINVEVRYNYTYVYFDKIPCLGGYPVSSLGKGLLMLSGGIDSPVAGYLAIKRGIKLEGIYFESPPHTSIQAKNKVIELAKILSEYNLEFKLHIINFTEIQEAIYKNIPHEYMITIMRRMMYRISQMIARRSNCRALITGESVGQVASQTLTSLSCINEVINIPVIRPVACFDKLEIIDVAKKINSYETSILPFEDCCTIFVPEHPVINPEYQKCIEYEKLIDYEPMILKAVKEHEKITCQEQSEYQELL